MTSASKVAIIGAGTMGLRRAKAVEDYGDEVFGIYDTDANKVFDAGYAMLADPRTFISDEVDTVIICTPNNTHGEFVIAALEAEKHVLVEKPLALRTRDAEEAAQLAITVDRKLQTGYQLRQLPHVQAIGHARHEIGTVLGLEISYGSARGDDFWGSWRENAREAGGGVLTDQGSHALDLAHAFIPGLVVEGAMTARGFGPGIEADARVLLRGGNEESVAVHVSWTHWWAHFELILHGDLGFFRATGGLGPKYPPPALELTLNDGTYARHTSEPVDLWLAEWKAFRDDLRICTDGLAATHLVAEARELAR